MHHAGGTHVSGASPRRRVCLKCQAFQPAPPLLRPGVRAIAARPSRIRLHAIGPTGPGHSIRCLIIIHDKTVPDIPLALFNTVEKKRCESTNGAAITKCCITRDVRMQMLQKHSLASSTGPDRRRSFEGGTFHCLHRKSCASDNTQRKT